ncbi:MAG: hypothetical protein A2Z14_04390 [Chloroflexi bacterium RBG_16_48_8]|nr:MAG: hypothetical protein A2Z14_04390 [Chloroflexi bacterium RBG_16_48_8]
MERKKRSNIGVGVLLILIGAFSLVYQLVPGLQDLMDLSFDWPVSIIAFGLFLLVLGLLVGAPGMAVPAMIFAGIGGLLYWQNATGNWESWGYVWTLIPGFVGLGVFLAELLEGKVASAIQGGGMLILISLIMFLIFSSFMGGPEWIGPYWPILIILLGVIMLVRSIFRKR